MRIDKAIRDFLIEIEIRKYTPKTIRSYRNNLSLFLRFCEEKAGIEYTEDISLPVIKQFVQTLSDSGRKGTYINSLLKTAKSFIQCCYEEGNGGFNTRKNFEWCKEDKRSVLSNSTDFCGVLLHEFAHYQHGFADNTRDFENDLTNMLGHIFMEKIRAQASVKGDGDGFLTIHLK